MLFESFSRTFWWDSNWAWIDVLIPRNWKRYIFHRGLSWNFQSILIPGGKEKDKARQAVFLTPTNLFGNDPEERSHMMISQFHRKHFMLLNGNLTKVPYTGYNCQSRRIKDWNSGRRSHLQSWLTLQYLEIVLIVWHLKMESEQISKGLKLQVGHLRYHWKRIGIASSSSIPLLAQTYLAR